MQFAPGKRLASQLARRLLERATSQLKHGELQSAWRDWELAGSIENVGNDSASLEVALLDRCYNDIEQHLANRDPKHAQTIIDFLDQHQVRSDRLTTLKQVTECFKQSQEFARQGDFSHAAEQLKIAAGLMPDLPVIEGLQKECQTNMMQCRKLKDQLQMALLGEDWNKTLEFADKLLELSPELRLAQDARQRAWERVGSRAVEPVGTNACAIEETHHWVPSQFAHHEGANGSRKNELRKEVATIGSPRSETDVIKKSAPRFLLWVDAVGGYLVCLANEVVIGQALPDSQVDIPILGDLSREHARIRRDREDYLIDPIADVRIRGKKIGATALLVDGDDIELGKGVTFRFRKPHPLSASAILELTSRHRTQPWADGVLLMAESCVLGPNRANHVVCRDWNEDLVLFQQEDGLYCRGMNALQIDGQNCDGFGRVSYNSRITGNDFSMSLEEI